jgi:hypothetical protein
MNQYMNVNVEISRDLLYTSDFQIVNVYLIPSLLKYGLHTPWSYVCRTIQFMFVISFSAA